MRLQIHYNLPIPNLITQIIYHRVKYFQMFASLKSSIQYLHFYCCNFTSHDMKALTLILSQSRSHINLMVTSLKNI